MSKSKMTIEQAIKHYEALQKRFIKTHNGKACEVTVAALEALKEKLEREKGCAWCNAEYTIIDDDFGQPVHPNKIKYCFACGHKLGGGSNG